MQLFPNPSDTTCEIYQRRLIESSSSHRRLRYLRYGALDSNTFPEAGIDRLSLLFVRLKSRRFSPGELINWTVVEQELVTANGRRRRGVIIPEGVREVAVPAIGLTATRNYVLMASSRWRRRTVRSVTAVVVMALTGGEALGYAVALPTGHPLLCGDIFQPLSDLELKAFFPVAHERKLRGYESARMPRFVPEPSPDAPLTTTLDLI